MSSPREAFVLKMVAGGADHLHLYKSVPAEKLEYSVRLSGGKHQTFTGMNIGGKCPLDVLQS